MYNQVAVKNIKEKKQVRKESRLKHSIAAFLHDDHNNKTFIKQHVHSTISSVAFQY